MEAFRLTADTVTRFCDEKLTRAKGAWLPQSELYPVYRGWVLDEGQRPLAKQSFLKRFRTVHGEPTKRGVLGYQDLRWIPE